MKGKTALALLGLLILASGCASQTQSGSEDTLNYTGLLDESESPDLKASYTVNSSINQYQGLNLTYYRHEDEGKIVATQETPGGTFVTSSYFLENGTVVCTTQPALGEMETTCKPGLTPEAQITVLPERWNLLDLAEKTREGCRAFEADVNVSGMERVPVTGEANVEFCLDVERKIFRSFNVSSGDGYLSVQLENVSRPETSELDLPRKVGIAGHCLGSYEVDLTPFRDIEEATFSIGGFNKTVQLPEKFEMGVYSFPEDVLSQGSNEITVYAGGEVQTKSCYSD